MRELVGMLSFAEAIRAVHRGFVSNSHFLQHNSPGVTTRQSLVSHIWRGLGPGVGPMTL